MAGVTVNEKSPLFMSLTFKDENDAPFVPTTVDWRLDDLETDTTIVDWTALSTPASSMNHTLTATHNVINNSDSVREERRFAVRIDVGLDTEAHQDFQYHVINLFGAP